MSVAGLPPLEPEAELVLALGEAAASSLAAQEALEAFARGEAPIPVACQAIRGMRRELAGEPFPREESPCP